MGKYMNSTSFTALSIYKCGVDVPMKLTGSGFPFMINMPTKGWS